MSKSYYSICNHWTEAGIGYAFPSGWYKGKYYENGFSSVYTVEKMLDGYDKYGVIVGMELDAHTYEVLKNVAPETLERLKTYVKNGYASIEGGTYAQPLGQDYGWESNIKHLTYGRKTIKELLDYDTNTFLVEEQWFHPQLPQLLLKAGFKYASLQCQNSGQVFPLNKSLINWLGLDGSKIPTIPANNLMVSCTRQYSDYSEYLEIFKNYKNPLLFQWVEVWVPGMDWGASIDPFEKAILHAKELELEPTSLNGYFEKELDCAKLDDYFISYNDSNYGNDWYQGGGWGFDGDAVIYLNKIAEEKMSNLENYCFYNPELLTQIEIDTLWKTLLIYQNHDTSAARSYRAYTKDGILSNSNSIVINGYKNLIKKLDNIIGSEYLEFGVSYITFNNFSPSYITKCFKIKSSSYISLKINDEVVKTSQTISNDIVELTCSFFAIPHRKYKFEISFGDYTIIESNENILEYDGITIRHVDGWNISIEHDETIVNYEAFSGSIGKANEHDEFYHALSPAHKQFTFSFDGPKHCPDQTSSMYVKCLGVFEDELFKSIELYCDLLTLHTSDTPVAFAKSTVRINKVTKEVETNAYLYTGVYLNIDSSSKFTHNLSDVKVYRDYPFYEEEASVSSIYALSYTRLQNSSEGFTIMNFGNQRQFLSENGVECLTSKSRLFGQHNFNFKLKFNTVKPVDSLNFVQNNRVEYLCNCNELIINGIDDNLIISQLFTKGSNLYIRVVNYSDRVIENEINIDGYKIVSKVDFNGNKISENFTFNPYEICTLHVERK